ncbi:MAG: DUF4383 domain-containing protein [Pseudonocardiales bacterium]|nr:DUF4383 domain-containing protein [Pseudonocardiales bacterium]PZS23179.1 MAG: DUF4383 domain-containing protein [Pseudonocardiales bacterium]
MLHSPPGSRLDLVHRIGAAVLGAGLCLFGILGFVDRLKFLALHGKVVLGLASNGLLSTISVIVGAVLIGAALRGGRISSTITVAVGLLFLLSGLLNLAVLDTKLNLLAFRLSNVVFSFVAGMLLLFLGAYGRFSGGLSADNPYYQRRHREHSGAGDDHRDDEDDGLLAAELAVAAGHGTPQQEQLVHDDAQRRANEAHRRAWELYESSRTRDNGAKRIP